MSIQKKPAGSGPPGKSIRRVSKATVGGTALLLAWLAFMLLRSGSGGTGQPADDSGGSENATRPPLATGMSPDYQTISTPQPAAADESADLTVDERQVIAGGVLTVLINEHDYLIQIPSVSEAIYRPAELNRIVDLADRVTGDSNGIRVRILRRDNARASAEEQLKRELSGRGIGSDAVHLVEQFVP